MQSAAIQLDLNKSELGDAAQTSGSMADAAGALWQVLQPYLSLRQVMLLAGSCRAWHQLIPLTPVCELSEEARQAVIPSGLTSSLPLLPLVQQQAQLIARIRGKDGALPRIQHVSFEAPGPKQPISLSLAWSPCTCLEDASRWIVLDFGLQHVPMVIDVETGQQVCAIGEDAASAVGPMWHGLWMTSMQHG